MNFIFSPAITLTNKLPFKGKFSLLALLVFIPIIASSWWIVSSQWQRISQYDLEMEGLVLIVSAIKLEHTVHEQGDIDNQARVLSKQVLQSSFAGKLADVRQKIQQQAADNALNDYQRGEFIYEQTLTFRENMAALSGLSRESEAGAFYLEAMVVQDLPALTEYLSRTAELTNSIIANGGFSSESYTLLVALDKRLDELQMKLSKANKQLLRVDKEITQSYKITFKII